MSFRNLTTMRMISVFAVGAFALATPLYADFSEGSFEDGSFGDAASEPAAAPAPDTSGSSDGFDEGSFNDDGSPKDQPSSSGTVPAAPVVADDAAAVEEREPEPTGTQDQADSQTAETIDIDPQIYAYETRDYGVSPQNTLRNTPLSGPTPLEVPGGYTVSTQGLVDAYLASTEMIVIDVLGNNYGLPDAFVLQNLGNPGHFNDRTQQQASIWLNNVTGGDASYPIVLYCSDPQCWLSYNGALRVIAAGYSNVYWYRGGIRAWEMAGLTVYPTGF
ncbi:MAG: rhodanese-like domain-containing protein [Pseudomonadota bacterium]